MMKKKSLRFLVALQFNKNEGMILADAIEGKKDIDLERAKKSMERAKERLEKKIQIQI